MIIVSVDVGYVNLGLTRCELDSEYKPHFTHAMRIDIRRILHTRIPASECTIPHTCETCDRVAHFIQEYEPFFNEADHVLIERQPLTGLKDVEALIMSRYRSKVTLVSPNKMHKFFGIGRFDYDKRKEKTEEIAHEHLGHLESYTFNTRCHDMADSACMTLFFADNLRRKNPKRLPFDEYRFVKT